MRRSYELAWGKAMVHCHLAELLCFHSLLDILDSVLICIVLGNMESTMTITTHPPWPGKQWALLSPEIPTARVPGV